MNELGKEIEFNSTPNIFPLVIFEDSQGTIGDSKGKHCS
jgi:hypothetical protein